MTDVVNTDGKPHTVSDLEAHIVGGQAWLAAHDRVLIARVAELQLQLAAVRADLTQAHREIQQWRNHVLYHDPRPE